MTDGFLWQKPFWLPVGESDWRASRLWSQDQRPINGHYHKPGAVMSVIVWWKRVGVLTALRESNDFNDTEVVRFERNRRAI